MKGKAQREINQGFAAMYFGLGVMASALISYGIDLMLWSFWGISIEYLPLALFIIGIAFFGVTAILWNKEMD